MHHHSLEFWLCSSFHFLLFFFHLFHSFCFSFVFFFNFLWSDPICGALWIWHKIQRNSYEKLHMAKRMATAIKKKKIQMELNWVTEEPNGCFEVIFHCLASIKTKGKVREHKITIINIDKSTVRAVQAWAQIDTKNNILKRMNSMKFEEKKLLFFYEQTKEENFGNKQIYSNTCYADGPLIKIFR